MIAEMPGLVSANQRKRKRAVDVETELANVHRKAKIGRSSNEHPAALDNVEDLERGIRDSRKNLNNIVKLLNVARSTKNDATVAVVSLCRVFCRLLAEGKLSKPHAAKSQAANSQAAQDEATVVSWLRDRLTDYRELLLALIQDERPHKCKLGLALSMQIVKGELAISKSSVDAMRTGTFPTVMQAILQSSEDSRVTSEFINPFFNQYNDVRFYTLLSVANILSHKRSPREEQSAVANATVILSSMPPVPVAASKLDNFFFPSAFPKQEKQKLPYRNVASHQKEAQRAWLALLNKPLDTARRKQILQIMIDVIVPWFTDAIHLMDFLTDSFKQGGATALLALSGLFSLMKTKNLDYPSFYPKVYSLLDKDVLHSTHRSRFLRLLNDFLGSSHLPAALVASFIKRLSRLALHAPPAAIVAIFPLVYNLLQAHPTCTFMIHREPRTNEERALIAAQGTNDTFDMDQPDPMQTEAIDSCLWELVTLQNHYHPNVASLANIISQQFTKASYNFEDFLDHSYQSLISAELGKELKKPPVVEFEIPKRVFVDSEGDATLESLMNRILDTT